MADNETSQTTTYSAEQMQGLAAQLQQNPELAERVMVQAQALGTTDPQVIAGLTQQNLNQQSVNNEAALVQGGYDPTVASAVSASVGVGGDEQHAQQAAADFARMAAQAIANGQPLDQIRFDDPTLTVQAKEAIYEQVAQQQGTTPEQIAQKAEQQRQADMAAVQGAVGGMFGLAGAATGAGLLATVASEDRPYGVAADAMPFRDMGPTGAALAAMGQFTPQADLPGQQRQREQGFGMSA